MRRRIHPGVEGLEARQVPSAITDILASQGPVMHGGGTVHAAVTGGSSGGSGSAGGGQGSGQATMSNQFLTPTGQPKPGQVRRQTFLAVFTGPFIQRPGFFTTEASRTNILGVGTTKASLHADLQLGALVPTDPTAPTAGAAVSFDRNINANSSLGIDLSGSPTDVDRFGRPTKFTWTIDDNTSAGVYVEAVGQGTVNIRYMPSGETTPGLLSQGQAIVTIRGQLYSVGVANILRVLGSQNNLDPKKISF
jgi:hypothetical protein